MMFPIAVEVREGAGYIRYRDDKPVATVDLMESCSVAVDVTAQNEVIGIEILDVASPEQVNVARHFARVTYIITACFVIGGGVGSPAVFVASRAGSAAASVRTSLRGRRIFS
jgi:hypothetical protein